MASEPVRRESPSVRHHPGSGPSAGEGRWLARLLVAGLPPDWSSFSTEELAIAEGALDQERGRLEGRGIDCSEAAVATARVELARERSRRLHLA